MRLNPSFVLRHPAVLLGAFALTFAGAYLLFRRAWGPDGGGPIFGPEPEPFLKSGDRVLLVGDSLAVGLTKPMSTLAKAAGFEFKGRGVTGSRIDEWDEKFLGPELAWGPTVVVVSLGTNDMKLFDPTAQAPHVASLIAKIRDAGARVVWLVPPSMPFADKGVRQMILDAKPDFAVIGEELELARSADKIHMTPGGYEAFANAAWTCVTDKYVGDRIECRPISAGVSGWVL